MHVHDPSLPEPKRLHFLVETVNYCNKSLSQRWSGRREFRARRHPDPQWAFCHTRSVKSRTFVDELEETAIPLYLGLFVIEITGVPWWGNSQKGPVPMSVMAHSSRRR